MLAREATLVALVACVTFAVTARTALTQQLLLAARDWVEARAGSLLVVALVMLLGLHQVTTHVFHPVIIAVFGGKPKVVLTQDHIAPAFSPVREVFLRNVVQGRSLGVQCVVFQKGELVVDLCGAPEPITVKPPPPPSRDGVDGGQIDREEEQAYYEWATDPDAYHPHAVQPVWGASCALATLAAAIAVDRGWLRYDARVKEYWPEFSRALTVSELLREGDISEAGPVAIAVLLERVDPHKRTLGSFIQEELGNKLQLGGGLRHASLVQQTGIQPGKDKSLPAQAGKDDRSSDNGTKLETPSVKQGIPKSEAEWEAAVKAAARKWYPLVDPTLTEVPAYKLELCAAVAGMRGWDTALPAKPRPARGGWLANGRSLALISATLARGGRTADGVSVISKEALSRAEGLLKDNDVTTSERNRQQQLMGLTSAKTVGGWDAAAIGPDPRGGTGRRTEEGSLLIGSAGFQGGFLAWSASLELGVGVATAGEFPHCMADDPSHPMRLLADAILSAAQSAAEQDAASTATKAAAEDNE